MRIQTNIKLKIHDMICSIPYAIIIYFPLNISIDNQYHSYSTIVV